MMSGMLRVLRKPAPIAARIRSGGKCALAAVTIAAVATISIGLKRSAKPTTITATPISGHRLTVPCMNILLTWVDARRLRAARGGLRSARGRRADGPSRLWRPLGTAGRARVRRARAPDPGDGAGCRAGPGARRPSPCRRIVRAAGTARRVQDVIACARAGAHRAAFICFAAFAAFASFRDARARARVPAGCRLASRGAGPRASPPRAPGRRDRDQRDARRSGRSAHRRSPPRRPARPGCSRGAGSLRRQTPPAASESRACRPNSA